MAKPCLTGVLNLCHILCFHQVIDLLNDLYTTFDSILNTFDVYKVTVIPIP